MKYVRRFLIVVIILMLLSAAGLMLQQRNLLPFGPPVPGAEATPVPTAASEPESTPEPTPAPTPEVTPEPTPEPTPAPTPAPDWPAEQLQLTLAPSDWEPRLLDGDFMTYADLPGGYTLVLHAEQPIAGLYLVWNDHPQPWTLETPDGAIEGGAQGYMHEYVELPSPAQEVTLRLGGEPAALCDLFAFGTGILPDWVQRWEPPYEQADILLFSAHADDEFIFFGGVIPAYEARGLNVQVAYMTSPYIGTERFRCHELLNGLWTAGLHHYPVTTGLRDWVMNTLADARYYYGEEVFVDFQVEQIRRFRPQVVLGHDLDGEYGHAVHMLSAIALTTAVEAAADPARFSDSAEKYGAWDTPKFYLHLYGDAPTILDYETPLEAFGGRTAYEIALDAYAEHLSQQHWTFTVYSFDSPMDSHRFGLYRSTVGEDETRNDLMEHLSSETEG